MKFIKELIRRWSYPNPMARQYIQQGSGITDRYTMHRICVSIAVPTGNYIQPIEQTKETIALLLAKEIVKEDIMQLRYSEQINKYTKKETYYIYVAKELIKDVVSISGQDVCQEHTTYNNKRTHYYDDK